AAAWLERGGGAEARATLATEVARRALEGAALRADGGGCVDLESASDCHPRLPVRRDERRPRTMRGTCHTEVRETTPSWRAERPTRLPRNGQAPATLLASTPIFSTSASILSPAFRNLPSAAPTPSGVPVAMTSPGRIVKPWERTAM